MALLKEKEIEQFITKMIIDIFDGEVSEKEIIDSGFDTNIFELGFDSMMVLELVVMIEREYGINIPDNIWGEEFNTINQIVSYIHLRVNKN